MGTDKGFRGGNQRIPVALESKPGFLPYAIPIVSKLSLDRLAPKDRCLFVKLSSLCVCGPFVGLPIQRFGTRVPIRTGCSQGNSTPALDLFAVLPEWHLPFFKGPNLA